MLRKGLLLFFATGVLYSTSSFACDGKAEPYKTTYETTWFNTCSGESMTGTIKYHRVTKCKPVEGGYDFNYKYNVGGQMIGANTGTKYVAHYNYERDFFYEYPIYSRDYSYYLRYIPTGAGNDIPIYKVRYDCSYYRDYSTGEYEYDCQTTPSCD